MKRKDQAAVKATAAGAASRSKESTEDKTESASESDAESSNDTATSSDDEQETAGPSKREKMAGVDDFNANMSKYDDDDNDDDGELLLKKTGKTDKLLQLQDDDKALAKPAQSQVILVMSALF